MIGSLIAWVIVTLVSVILVLRRERRVRFQKRWWCSRCQQIIIGATSQGTHRVWEPRIIQGVDFGKWLVHEGLWPEAEGPRVGIADGKVTLAGDEVGRVALAEKTRGDR